MYQRNMNDQDFIPLAFLSSNGSKWEVSDLIRNKLIQMYLEFINDKSKKLSIIKLSKPISLHPKCSFLSHSNFELYLIEVS